MESVSRLCGAQGHREDPELKPPTAAREHGLRKRILLAEDNSVNQRLVTKMLEKQGYDVTVAGNGSQAVSAVQESAFDLVFMDCQMPEMDGFAATASIRALEQAARSGTQGSGSFEHGRGLQRKLPVVALTANALIGDREKCLAAGMDDYLSKPITLPELSRVLQRWLAPSGI
jgi:two-component system, sensor histidine kinase and response regulator